MKFTGFPDWDNLSSIEFLDIQLPSMEEPCVMNAVGRISISGVDELGYTEGHLIEDTYFIAIFTTSAPNNSNTQFKRLTLDEIVVSLSIER